MIVKRGALESIASRLAPTVPALAGSPVGAGLSGRRIAAMVVNDNAGKMDKHGALESIASRLALTVSPGHKKPARRRVFSEQDVKAGKLSPTRGR
ncbi:hypothetical protein C1X64_10505 [Pseudomonas sp. GW456-E7]|nr:hypothetical protein C1X64_10505 [Pseudomonas sp. GW456-E7]